MCYVLLLLPVLWKLLQKASWIVAERSWAFLDVFGKYTITFFCFFCLVAWKCSLHIFDEIKYIYSE